MADPDLELRVKGGGGGHGQGWGGEGGLDLLALLTFSPSVISSFFTQNNWGHPLDPPLILIGNAAFYLPSSPANTVRIPVLCAAGIFWAMNILRPGSNVELFMYRT